MQNLIVTLFSSATMSVLIYAELFPQPHNNGYMNAHDVC